jgi:glutaredoxin
MAASRRALFSLIGLVLGTSAAVQAWHGWRQVRLGEQVAAAAQPGDIRIISSDTCEACVWTREWLQRHDVAFSECSIERDAACARDFAATRAPGTPVVLVRGRPQVGFDPRDVLAELVSGAAKSLAPSGRTR